MGVYYIYFYPCMPPFSHSLPLSAFRHDMPAEPTPLSAHLDEILDQLLVVGELTHQCIVSPGMVIRVVIMMMVMVMAMVMVRGWLRRWRRRWRRVSRGRRIPHVLARCGVRALDDDDDNGGSIESWANMVFFSPDPTSECSSVPPSAPKGRVFFTLLCMYNVCTLHRPTLSSSPSRKVRWQQQGLIPRPIVGESR